MPPEPWFAGADRRERAADALERNTLDALLSLTPENSHYLSGEGNFIATYWRHPGLYSAALGTNGRLAVVSGELRRDPLAPAQAFELFPYTGWTETLDVRDQHGATIADRVVAARPLARNRPAQFDFEEIFDRVADAVRSVAPAAKRVGVDLEFVDVHAVQRLEQRLPNVELVDASAIFDDLRAIKDPDEIEHLRRAAALTDIGIQRAIDSLQIGQSELAVNTAYHLAVRAAADHDRRYRGFREPKGSAQIGFGIDSPGQVAPGQTVKFDMQVDVAGYHSDIGRTVAFDPTPDQRAVYEALHAGLAEMAGAVRPGLTFAGLHAIGTEGVRRAGFSNYSRGHLGHGDGLTQHFEESPFIAADEHRPIAPNMVLSVETPYYLYGVGAFQLERMVLVTETGAEWLDALPFELDLAR